MARKRKSPSRSSGSFNLTQTQIIAIVILVVIIALVYFFVLPRFQTTEVTQTPTPNTAADITPNPDDPDNVGAASNPTPRTTLETGGQSVEIGSGGTVKSDWYELDFTKPIYPDNPANHKGGLDEKLVAFMDKATKTLDVADYDFDLANVAAAMVRAKQRGVTVRMVTDSDTINAKKNAPVQAALKQLKDAGITYIGDERGPIMHNKFTVVDNKWVQTGSWNYTDGDTYHLNNNMIIIYDAKIAANYTAEFEKMFVQKKFGPTKPEGVPNPVVTVSGVRVENCFSSETNCVSKILPRINEAKSSIYFMAFSYTQDDMEKAMTERAKAGVKVEGVFETTGSETKFSAYGPLKAAGVPVYQDGNPWVMHHKVIILDEKTVIFGSFNFSDNANKSNDENLLIIDDANLAKAFKAEYDRVLDLAKKKK